MKKLVSVVLALTMVMSMFITVSAAGSVASYISSTDEYFLSYTLPITIEARRSNPSGAYVASPLNIVDSSLPNGIGVDFMATLDMEQLQTLFSSSLMTGFLAELEGDLAAKTEFEAAPVTTTVTVKIEYPGATIANADTAGSLMSGDTKFVQNGNRVINGNTAEITYNNTTLTVGELMSNQSSWLEDVVFTLEGAEAAVYNTEGSHEVKVTFSGETALGFTSLSNPIKIKYTESTATYTVEADIPSTGGGGSSYNSIKFVTNGGSELKNISVRRGSKAELPVPTREGYVFDGWYTDSNLTTPFDADTVINRNYTLYAKWVELGECSGTAQDNCPCLNYYDLDPTMWYHRGVDYVLNRGMMIGVDTTQFAPDLDVTRAMLVTVLWRAEGKPAAANTTFTDLEDGLYYVDAVKWAAANGVVNGYSDTVFAPNDAITREQFAAIMYRYAKNKGYDVSVGENTNILSYSDYDAISEYAIEAMQYTLGSGLIKGRTETTLNPKDNTTRAEMATILYRFFTESK